MKKKRFASEQIVASLKQPELRIPVAELGCGTRPRPNVMNILNIEEGVGWQCQRCGYLQFQNKLEAGV